MVLVKMEYVQTETSFLFQQEKHRIQDGRYSRYSRWRVAAEADHAPLQ